VSIFGGPILGGFGFPFGGYVSRADAPADPQAKAEPNEPAERNAYVGSAVGGFPGFGKAPPGTPALYWEMAKYSACVLAYVITTGPIFAGTRTLEICRDDGTPARKRPNGPLAGDGPTQSPEDKIKVEQERHFGPLWPDILNGLECLNQGNWLQEVLWDRVESLTLPVRFKDFLPGEAMLAVDPYGDFAGYRPSFAGGTFDTADENDRAPQYALLHVHQPHKNRIWGFPRLENCREPWYRATKTDNEIDKALQKSSGISLQVLIDHEFAFRDDSGNKVTAKQAAQTYVNALANGGTAMGPRYTFTKAAMEKNPELAKIKPIETDQFDWGSTAPAILAGIAALDARDKRIMRAYGRPEREAMEGEHGTKAESGVQGAIGTLDSEKVHAERVDQFNKQTWRTLLRTNWGDKYLGKLYWKPTPLSDPQQSFLQDVAKALASAPGSTFGQRIDEKALAKRTELPIDENYEPPPLPTNPQEAGMDGEPVNGNGNPERMRALGLSGGPYNGDPFDEGFYPAWLAEAVEKSKEGGAFVPIALNCGTGAGGFKPGNRCQNAAGHKFVVSRVDRKGTLHGRGADESADAPPVPLGHVSEFAAAETPLSAAPLPEFAERVKAIADGLPERFGDDKVLIGDVYKAAKSEDSSLTPAEFKTKLRQANHEGLVELSRADLVSRFHPDDIKASSVNLDLRRPATATGEVGETNTAEFIRVRSDWSRRQVRGPKG
jgi:hypothetical protein